MNVNIKYIFECKDGFKFERETPEEIIRIMQENYDALKKIATGNGDFCNYFIDASNEYFPKGTICASIDGTYMIYTLKTEITPIK